ncbi:MAG: hypothetical protein K2K27_04290 [Muribaculaceae bacterium]|nr:hypothetical protein [Muribaculaceae bacterium]
MDKTYKTLRSQAIEQIRNHRLKPAIAIVRQLGEKFPTKDYARQADSILEDYNRLLDHFETGGTDPGRVKSYESFVNRTLKLLDVVIRRIEMTDDSSQFYNVYRFEATRPDDTVAALIERYMKMSDEMSIFNFLTSDELSEQMPYGEKLKQREALERRIFNRLWVTFPLVSDNYDAVAKLLSSDEVGYSVKHLVVSSLLLSLFKFYDENKLALLFDVYNRYAGDIKSALGPVSLTAILLIMFQYPERPMSDVLSLRLSQAAEQPTWVGDLQNSYAEIVRTRDTERINRKMADDVIPGLLKIRPDIAQRHLDASQMADISELDENPEWMEVLEKSGIADRLKEMTEIQEEGGDVFMSTFAHLKNYTFFNEIANWFLPFTSEYSGVMAENKEEAEPIADMLVVSPFLCNSDKYSFFYSLMQVPESQRSFMLSQFKTYNVNLAELRSAAINETAVDRRNAVNKYVQDLYRFFNLYSRHNEFDDPFKMIFNIFKVGALKDWVMAMDNAQMIAEFYFNHKYYGEALEMFRAIEKTMPPSAELYQKIGFCLQKGGEIEAALEYYRRAELIDSRSVWTLKRIGGCLMILGQFREAAECFERIDALQPDNESVILNLINCYIEIREYGKALPLLHKVLYYSPDDTKALRMLAWVQLATGDYKNATANYERLVIEFTATPTDYVRIGHIAYMKGDVTEAIKNYRLAMTAGVDVKPAEVTRRIENEVDILENGGADIALLPFVIEAVER